MIGSFFLMRERWPWVFFIGPPKRQILWWRVRTRASSASLWKGNERLVFFADVGGNESFFVGATDLSGKRVIRIVESQIYEYPNSSFGGMISGMRFDENRLLVNGRFVDNRRGSWIISESTTDDFVET